MREEANQEIREIRLILNLTKSMIRMGMNCSMIDTVENPQMVVEVSILTVLKKLEDYFVFPIGEKISLEEAETGIKQIYDVAEIPEVNLEDALIYLNVIKKGVQSGRIEYSPGLGTEVQSKELREEIKKIFVTGIALIGKEVMGREKVTPECENILNQSIKAALKEYGSLEIPIL